jgi:hypothetical protein
MSAIAIRQKDQEMEELKKELEMQRSMLVDLEESQKVFEEKMESFGERTPSEDPVSSQVLDELREKVEGMVTQQQMRSLSEGLKTRIQNFIQGVNNNLRLNDADGISRLPDELDSLGGRVAGIEEDIRNVRRGKEFIEERLGKLEGLCLNVMANEILRNPDDCLDKRVRVERAVGWDRVVDDDAVRKEVQRGKDVKGGLSEVHGSAGATDLNTISLGDVHPRPSTPSNDALHGLVPSIDDGRYIFNAVDGSPVDRAKTLD